MIGQTNSTAAFNTDACWISPAGKILNISDTQTHVGYICKNTKLFKLHSDSIRDIYSSFGEVKGTEGKASEVIIKKLIADGWIRFRKIDDAKIFLIHCNFNNDKVKENIKPLIAYIKNKQFADYKIALLNKEEDKISAADSFKKNLLLKEFEETKLKFKIFNESEGFYYDDFLDKF
jgi:hypothetical protein